MNLTEFTARVRDDLKDTDSANYIWSDDEIEGAILRTVDEYSMRAPIQQQTNLPTTDGDTEIDISALTGLTKIESVEFPLNQDPKHMQHFDYWAGNLYIQDEGDGTNARIRWLKKHTVGESSTIPTEHDEIIVLGATGYLAMSASAYIVDKAAISGRYGTQNYKLWGRERLRRYDFKLNEVASTNRIVSRNLYADD